MVDFYYYQELPEFDKVAAGKAANLNLPTGPTYGALLLNYNTGTSGGPTEANMKDEINTIKLSVGGTSRIEISGKHAIDLQKYYGIPVTDGQVWIPLFRPWMQTVEAQENVGWGTRDVSGLNLRVNIDSGASNPELSADALILPEERDLGTIIEQHEFFESVSTSGSFDIQSLPKTQGDLVAVHLDNSNIDEANLFINKTPFKDGTIAGYHSLLEYQAERNPQSGYVHLDAINFNRWGNSWPLVDVNSFIIRGNITSGGQIPIVMETLNTPFAN
jgi:hypothetical protein